MKKTMLPAALGVAHGISDCSAGLIIGSLSSGMSIYGIGSMVLLYNILAFAVQPLAGLLTDKLKSPKLAAVAGLGLMAASVACFFVQPVAAVVMAGIASAFFHVGGGALALCVSPGKASAVGLFSSPGVAGLAIGGYLAVSGIFPAAIVIALLLVLMTAISFLKTPDLPYQKSAKNIEFETHDFVMLAMLFAIALRSAVWNIFQYVEQGEITNIILISLAAAGGKIFGGYAGDHFGWKRYTYAAMFAALPLLILGEKSFYFLLPGIALLQSVTPVLVSALYKGMSRLPATAAGLSFGLAIAAGGVPFAAGADPERLNTPIIIAAT
ncbi:MAG: MFS transporter, partial [Ignavibacteria bacterium]|nr:MFS transporter [Ignavibacteria bacterium]